MIELYCNVAGLEVKLTVGIRKTNDEYIQYCVTAVDIE